MPKMELWKWNKSCFSGDEIKCGWDDEEKHMKLIWKVFSGTLNTKLFGCLLWGSTHGKQTEVH